MYKVSIFELVSRGWMDLDSDTWRDLKKAVNRGEQQKNEQELQMTS
jgi:hypothetical protein